MKTAPDLQAGLWRIPVIVKLNTTSCTHGRVLLQHVGPNLTITHSRHCPDHHITTSALHGNSPGYKNSSQPLDKCLVLWYYVWVVGRPDHRMSWPTHGTPAPLHLTVTPLLQSDSGTAGRHPFKRPYVGSDGRGCLQDSSPDARFGHPPVVPTKGGGATCLSQLRISTAGSYRNRR